VQQDDIIGVRFQARCWARNCYLGPQQRTGYLCHRSFAVFLTKICLGTTPGFPHPLRKTFLTRRFSQFTRSGLHTVSSCGKSEPSHDAGTRDTEPPHIASQHESRRSVPASHQPIGISGKGLNAYLTPIGKDMRFARVVHVTALRRAHGVNARRCSGRPHC